MVLAMIGGILLKFVNDSGFLGAFGQLILIDFFTEGLLDVVGQIFIASLRLVIVPLVFFSLVCGVVSISSTSRIGTISVKTLSLYLLTTAIAISIALTFALLFQPGIGIDLALPTAFESTTAPSLKEVLVNIFPTNNTFPLFQCILLIQKKHILTQLYSQLRLKYQSSESGLLVNGTKKKNF